jgi:hypothetical protein
MIVKKENKWLVMDSSGKKVLGTHYSKEEAKDQLAAIEISKKRKSMEESPNLLNNSMNNLTEYYKNICEELKNQIIILEKKVKEEKEKKHKKSDKKADKDYDGDGEVESDSEEYLGSRSNAIKKAIAKREGKNLKEDFNLLDGRFDLELGRVVSSANPYPNRADGIRYGGRRMPTYDPLQYRGINPKTGKPFESLLSMGKSSSELDAMRRKGEEIGGVPMPDKSSSELDAMRRKGEEIGGVPAPAGTRPAGSSTTDIINNMFTTSGSRYRLPPGKKLIDADLRWDSLDAPPEDLIRLQQRQKELRQQRGLDTDIFSGSGSGEKTPLGKVSPKMDRMKSGGGVSDLFDRTNSGGGVSDLLNRAQSMSQDIGGSDFSQQLQKGMRKKSLSGLASEVLSHVTTGKSMKLGEEVIKQDDEDLKVKNAMKAISGNSTLSAPSVRDNGFELKSSLIEQTIKRLSKDK